MVMKRAIRQRGEECVRKGYTNTLSVCCLQTKETPSGGGKFTVTCGGNLTKRNRSPGATVWQPRAAPPDDNVLYCGRTVHLRTQKKKE
jgi:hypothetical protein